MGAITVRCGGMMQLCKMRNAVQLSMLSDARCGGAMHNVANIWCDLKLMWRYVVHQ